MSTLHDAASTQLERLALAVEGLREESDRLRREAASDRRESQAEIAALKAEVARLRSTESDETASSSRSAEVQSDNEARTDRRGLFKVGGAAAVAAVGTAVGTGLLSATPAAAANGQNVLLGEINAATATTEVSTSAGTGLYGVCGGAAGFAGENGAAGVWGDSNAADGVDGTSSAYNGVRGITNATGQSGVRGEDASSGGGAGVTGVSTNGVGVSGASTNGYGVYGVSTNHLSSAIYGYDQSTSSGGSGVFGNSDRGTGVLGETGGASQAAVLGSDQSVGGGYGVKGYSAAGYALVGTVNTAGTTQPLAPLLLTPISVAGPPTSGAHQAGEFVVDSNGMLWTCLAGGTPGTWVKQSPFVPLGPARAYDSRSTGAGGPLSGGSTRTVSLTPAGFPAGASAALVNLTIVNTVGIGVLTLYAQGAPEPNTSNIGWSADNQLMANNATTKVGSTGEITVAAAAYGSTQFVIDVFGFYY